MTQVTPTTTDKLLARFQAELPGHTIEIRRSLNPDSFDPVMSVMVDGDITKVTWSTEMAQSLKVRHGVDIEGELFITVLEEIKMKLKKRKGGWFKRLLRSLRIVK